MKIAVVSLPLLSNYGGILQTYALQRRLSDMGHDVMTVAYERPAKWWTFPFRIFLRLKRKVESGGKAKLFPKDNFAVTSRNTARFIAENIRLTRMLTTNSSARDFAEYGFNAYVVGSDQVWRYSYFRKDIGFAFLKFLPPSAKVKRIAYAASFGKGEWEYPPSQGAVCSKLAKRFNAISVRESSGVPLCLNNLKVSAVHVLDPTMLFDAEDYARLVAADESRGFLDNKPLAGVCFSYVLDASESKSAFIAGACSKLGLSRYEIMPAAREDESDGEDIVFPPVTQWLKAFRDADFVITDSFHGTVFSIIFNKPFISIGNKSRGMARFDSLLGMFNLRSRLVNDISAVGAENVVSEKIDWDAVNAERAKMKIFSGKFLEDALGE